jgi:hypothetical protein
MPFIGNKPAQVPLTSADIADGIITTAKIADGNITSTKILDGTIATADLNTGLTVNLGAGAVGTPTLTTSGDTNTGIFFPEADTIAFAEGGAEVMRINSSGKILMNTTTASGGERVTVGYDSNTGPGLTIKDTTPQNGNTFIDFKNNATQAGSITSNGTSTTSYNTSSDYRLKENVNYNFDATTRLKQLKPARFNFIGDINKTVDGFIAHEVQEIIPEAIHGTKDQIDSEGKPVYQGIDQSKLTPILTKALQEAIAKIEILENRLTVLENI